MSTQKVTANSEHGLQGNLHKFNHVTPALKSLICKIAMQAYKCKTGAAPPYLIDLLSKHKDGRQLQTANMVMLFITRSHTVQVQDSSFKPIAPYI